MSAVDASGVLSAKSAWAGARPLVLASRSPARLALLASADSSAEVVAAELDERALEDEHFARGGTLEGVAAALALAKALAASAARPDAYCVGADQTLTLNARLLHKPANLAEAAETLAALSGQTHRLTSAFSVALAGETLVTEASEAWLTMRLLSRDEISRYLGLAGEAALSSVGAYQVESLGAHLFERIEGDHWTILGLPMLKLLAWFRSQGLLAL